MENLLDIEYDNSVVIQESYFGKRPEFVKAEAIVESIRKIIRSGKSTGTISLTQENKSLENIFKKVFGFKEVHILWIDAVVPNAFTIVSSFVYKGSKESKFIVKDLNKGYYDTNHSDILFVAVYTGLLGETDLSNDEFMGVILHEIGHNFDYSPYNVIRGITQRFITTDLKKQYYKQMEKGADFKARHKFTDDIYKEYLDLHEKIVIKNKVIHQVISKFFNIGIAVTLPMTFVAGAISWCVFTLIGSISSINGKKMENFADSFAVAYGYGSGCMSGLQKLMAYPKNLKNSSMFTKVLVDIYNCESEFCNLLTEVHGSNQERISLAISKLERDLKRGDFPPNMKADLEKELERLKDLQKQILTYNKDEWNYVTVTYRRIMQFLFKGTNIFHKLFPRNQA